MYDHIFSAMVKSNAAIELMETEVMVILEGTITNEEDDSKGRSTEYLLTYPQLV